MKRQRVRYFTSEDKTKFLTFLENHTAAKRAEFLYKLMFSTGLRLHEASKLNVGDVSRRERLNIVGKGNKEREIPLSRAIREEIAKFLIWKQTNGRFEFHGLSPWVNGEA